MCPDLGRAFPSADPNPERNPNPISKPSLRQARREVPNYELRPWAQLRVYGLGPPSVSHVNSIALYASSDGDLTRA